MMSPTSSLQLPLLDAAVIRENLEPRTPFQKFHLPVEHDRRGDNNQVRSPILLFTGKMSQKCNSLDCLPKTHFIGKDPVEFLIIHCYEPVQPNVLVLAEGMLQ